MTPQQFIAKWHKAQLSEWSAAQQHFLDLCELLGQPKPAAADPEGAWYAFERGVHKTGGGQGWADVLDARPLRLGVQAKTTQPGGSLSATPALPRKPGKPAAARKADI